MATAASLYSSSPPTIPSTHNSSSHCLPGSSPIDIELHARAHSHHHHHASRPVVGGLSSLFATPSVRYSPCSTPDTIGFEGSLSRRSSHTDLCALLDSCENRPESFVSSKIKERSPIASFQGPPSFSSPQSSINRFNNERVAAANSSSSHVTVSPFEQEDVLSSDNNLDLYYVNHGSFLSGIDLSYDRVEMRPDTPRLTKMACSSLSEFFCKPLFAEAFRTSQDILKSAQRQHEIFKDPFVIKAFEEAEHAHNGQVSHTSATSKLLLCSYAILIGLFCPMKVVDFFLLIAVSSGW